MKSSRKRKNLPEDEILSSNDAFFKSTSEYAFDHFPSFGEPFLSVPSFDFGALYPENFNVFFNETDVIPLELSNMEYEEKKKPVLDQLHVFETYMNYYLMRDGQIDDCEKNLYLDLQTTGLKLIAEYYAEKYHCDISISNDLESGIEEAERKSGDFRKAFIYDDGFHATPCIFINENGKKAFLFVDSIKTSIDPALKEYLKNKKIPLFILKDKRQMDNYSCRTDAMVFARDITKRDPKNGSYYIPNLLTQLTSRSTFDSKECVYNTKLPNALLKTSQSSAFVAAHQEDDKAITVHKQKTLNTFRDEYTDKNVKYKGKIKNLPSYLRCKSLLFASMIEIRFYINEFRRLEPALFTEEAQNEFIILAKKVDGIGKSRKEYNEPVLHSLAETFLTTLRDKAPKMTTSEPDQEIKPPSVPKNK